MGALLPPPGPRTAEVSCGAPSGPRARYVQRLGDRVAEHSGSWHRAITRVYRAAVLRRPLRRTAGGRQSWQDAFSRGQWVQNEARRGLEAAFAAKTGQCKHMITPSRPMI